MPLPETPRLSARLLSLALLLNLAGCAVSSLDLAPPRPDRPWNPSTNADGAIVPGPAQADRPDASYTLPPNAGAAALPASPEIDASHEYTLPELIDLAQSSNPRTRIAWNAARNTALAAGIAKSIYLPQLAASAIAGWSHGRWANDTPLGEATSDNNNHGTLSVLSLQWLLFDFGGKQARVQAAEQASVASNIALTAIHQQVIQEVSVAYHSYIASRSRTVNARQGRINANTLLDAANARYRQGQGTVVEVAQATQNREQARLALVVAEGAEQDSYLALITAMGISPLSKPRIAAQVDRPLNPGLSQPVEQIISDALARRPDVLAAYAAERAEQAKARAADSDFLPKVFVSASTSYASGRSSITAVPALGQQAATVNLDGNRSGSNIFLGVTLPLYDGGMRSAIRMQAQNDAASASERLSRAKQEAARQIVAAQNALRSGIAANDAAASLLKAGRITYDAALASYRNGIGSLTDVTLAQSQMLAAQNAYADSLGNARSAATVLAVATGRVALPDER
ncbi:TolC family protein [Achromobacter xylosoxidans]|uniref:TolC family protein n=1 Tax=Alcaligenes xylosoxydans xylosoxydans TaxID=85698 RepID=UPI000B495011|nr:TolC family protein [Achromobacter xylosoxidans]